MKTKPKQEKKTQRVRMNTKIFSSPDGEPKALQVHQYKRVSESDTSAGLFVVRVR